MLKVNIHVAEKDSIKRLKMVTDLQELSFDIGYKCLKKSTTGYFMTITYNQSKYSDVLKGKPIINLMSDSLFFEFEGVIKQSLKPELIDLLLADKSPSVSFTDLRIYIPKYENFVNLTLQDNDDVDISMSFQKSKPKI